MKKKLPLGFGFSFIFVCDFSYHMRTELKVQRKLVVTYWLLCNVGKIIRKLADDIVVIVGGSDSLNITVKSERKQLENCFIEP